MQTESERYGANHAHGMPIDQNGRIAPLLYRAHSSAGQNRWAGNRSYVAYRSVLIYKNTQGDITLNPGKARHVWILRRDRVSEAPFLLRRFDADGSPEVCIEEASQFSYFNQVRHRDDFLRVVGTARQAAKNGLHLGGRNLLRSRCQAGRIADFDSSSGGIGPYAAIDLFGDNIAAAARESGCSENVTNTNVASARTQHSRPTDVACRDLSASRRSAKATRNISNTNVAARRFEPRDEWIMRESFIGNGTADIGGPDFAASAGKHDDAIDVLREDVAGLNGNIEVVVVRHVNLENQIAAATTFSRRLIEQHDTASCVSGRQRKISQGILSGAAGARIGLHGIAHIIRPNRKDLHINTASFDDELKARPCGDYALVGIRNGLRVR